MNRMTFKAGQTYIDDAGKSFVVTSASSSTASTAAWKAIAERDFSGDAIKKYVAELEAERDAALLSATAIAPDRDSIIEECALLAECASPNNGADHSQCPFCATAKDIRALKLGPVKHPGKE